MVRQKRLSPAQAQAALHAQVRELMGVTGWTPEQIGRLTSPQLTDLLQHQGQLMWPEIRAELAVKRLEGLHDEKGSKGEPSPVQKALDDYDKRKAGILEPMTLKDRRYHRAFRIVMEEYLGDPDAREASAQAARPEVETKPFPGMSREEARAILAWVRDGGCPDEVWAREVLPAWDAIRAAAKP